MHESMIDLQKQVKMLRLTVAAMLLGGIAYVCMGAAGDDVQDEVKTQKLVLVDKFGSPRAVLSCEGQSAALTFHSIDESSSARIGVAKSGGFVTVETKKVAKKVGPRNYHRAILTSGDDEHPPELIITDGAEENSFGADTGKPRVSPVARNRNDRN